MFQESNIKVNLVEADDSIKWKDSVYIDHFFSKTDAASLVKYIGTGIRQIKQ